MNKKTITAKLATSMILVAAIAFVTACPEKTDNKATALAAAALVAGGGITLPAPGGSVPSSITPTPGITTFAQMNTEISAAGAPACAGCHSGGQVPTWNNAGVLSYLGSCPATPASNKLISALSPGGRMYKKNSAAANARNAIAGWIQSGCPL